MYCNLLLLSKKNLWILQSLYFSTNINYKKVYIFAIDNGIKHTKGRTKIQIRDKQTPAHTDNNIEATSALCISARFTSLTAFFTFAYIYQQMKKYKCMLFTNDDLDESDE